MSKMDYEPEVRKVVVVGHVDHGKSSLLGQILLSCGKVPEDKVEYVRKICRDKGVVFEPAFLLDALQEEQDQGISIDTTRVNFEFGGQRFVLIDAPGHLEFLRNMTSGASQAEFGILVVDCQQGVRAQTERHLKILSILGIRQVIVALNKVDSVGYDQRQFEELCQSARAAVKMHGLECAELTPICALTGENITDRSENLSWFLGQPLLASVLSLAGKMSAETSTAAEPFRMVLQDVYRFDGQRRFVGRVLSGSIQAGAEIFFSPSGKISQIEAIEKYPGQDLPTASKGHSIALRLKEQVFVERGEIVSLPDQAPEVDTEFRARIAWLSSEPLIAGGTYLIKLGTRETQCIVDVLDDEANLAPPDSLSSITNGSFVEVLIRASHQLAFDRLVGGINKFVLCSTYETVAAGIVDSRAVRVDRDFAVNANVKHESGYLPRQVHEQLNGHRGTVVWLTGLSGAGKSTLAKALEQKLHESRCRVVTLDGDNLRSGLCADLGFSPEERSENIRRTAHVAKLFLEAGFIVVVACISPYTRDREAARAIIGSEDFNEVFVFCPLELCQQRDPKGLYKKASTGQVSSVTGFDSPYQPPQKPALRIDSSSMPIKAEVEAVVAMLARRGISSHSLVRSSGLAGNLADGVPRS